MYYGGGCDPEQRGGRPMGYRNLRACLADLERTGQLVRIEAEIDPYLEMAEIQRRVYAAGGPALYFARVKGCAFPMVSNLFGTIERTRFLFRDALAAVRHLVELKVDAAAVLEAAVALPRRAGRPAARAAEVRPKRADPRSPDDGEPAAAVEVLAARRRRLHHAAAGLHRGRGPARLAAFQPRHVPRAAFRQPVHSRIGKSACTTRFIAASASTTPRRCAAACRSASTSSSAGRRP